MARTVQIIPEQNATEFPENNEEQEQMNINIANNEHVHPQECNLIQPVSPLRNSDATELIRLPLNKSIETINNEINDLPKTSYIIPEIEKIQKHDSFTRPIADC